MSGESLRKRSVGCRVHVHQWGTSKQADAVSLSEVGDLFGANPKSLGLRKKLIDTRAPSYTALQEVLRAAKKHWHENTLPYVEHGVRLLRRDELTAFDGHLQFVAGQVADRAEKFNAEFAGIREAAKGALGTLYREAEYPDRPGDHFKVTVDYPELEPPGYLREIDPALYQKQAEETRRKFEQSLALAEEAMARELADMLDMLKEQLAPNPDGTAKKIFNSTASGNFLEFFDRFKRLKVTDGGQLEEVIKQAQNLVGGVDLKGLRKDSDYRAEFRGKVAGLGQVLAAQVKDKPRRKLDLPKVAAPAPSPTPEAAPPTLTAAVTDPEVAA